MASEEVRSGVTRYIASRGFGRARRARRTRTSFRRVGAQLSSYIGRLGKRSGYSGFCAFPRERERREWARIWSPLMMDGPS